MTAPVARPAASPWSLDIAVVVALGGAVGALLRLWLAGPANGVVIPPCGPAVLPAPAIAFPWGTLLVNVLGAGVLGVLMSWQSSPRWLAFWRTGVLGAFTTTSAFAVEAVALAGRPCGDLAGPAGHGLVLAGAYVAATLVGGLLAARGGVAAGRRLLGAAG